ncbi:hypothetical protein BDV98DRAFT_375880 [Pterulicium gracile]|uniref:Uncharacterized protein n=1 Tax=Pterulicium gracile TaxID=1884261 RepID=A0A5C3QAX3_9AGAR|nr:hypothetical protein BDV98DRAFT_375880 [Pterula gracilis]
MAEHIMDLNGVLGVDIKLEGTIQLTMPNGDHRTHPLANDVHSVYRTENSLFNVANSSTALSLQQSCPEILPFSIPCPSSTALPSYQDSLTESRQQASEVNASFFAGDLPPTLNIPLHNSACMIRHVTVVYSLVLTIWLRRLGSRVPLGPGTCMIERGDAATAPPKARFKKQFSIPVIYRPRARPQSPAIQRLSTITTQPDRWREVSWRTKQLGRGTSVTSQPLTVKLTIPAPFIFTAFQRLPFHLHVDCHSTALKEHLLRQDPNTPRFELEVSLIREFIVEPPMQYSTSSRYRGVRRAVLGKSQLTMVENPAESTVVAWAGAIVWLKGNSTFAGFGSFEGNVLSAEDRIVVAVRHFSTINTKETSVLRGLFQVRGSGKPDEVQEFSQDVRVITDLPGAEATQ